MGMPQLDERADMGHKGVRRLPYASCLKTRYGGLVQVSVMQY